jgi:hypothetical protein
MQRRSPIENKLRKSFLKGLRKPLRNLVPRVVMTATLAGLCDSRVKSDILNSGKNLFHAALTQIITGSLTSATAVHILACKPGYVDSELAVS